MFNSIVLPSLMVFQKAMLALIAGRQLLKEKTGRSATDKTRDREGWCEMNVQEVAKTCCEVGGIHL